MLFNFVIRMAVYNEQVDVAVIVVVEEFHSPTAHQAGSPANSHRSRQVVEGLVVVVPIDGIHLLVHVSDEEILPAILIEIRGVNAHPGARPPFLAESDAGFQTDIREFSVLLIQKQKILDGVIGYEKI